MSGTIWSKFFWSDWESDPNLRLCSLAAQGLWMRMLCIAAAHEPIGYVAIAGKGLDEAALARLSGCPEAELGALLAELEQNRVFSRDRRGRVYSRRMIADARKARVARRNGLKGGNPSLSRESAFSASDKRRARAGDKPQSPDSQNPQAIDPSGEKAPAFSPPTVTSRDRHGKAVSDRPAGQKWHRRNTHVDAANKIIEEINDRSRIAAGGESAGRDVFLLPAIRAR
ncbi:hypothetical protein EN828_27700 [Mesorhizobium sp. M2D.F.Ca.ET.185.01.1.1]|uniref:hypothetical protein n=1 Tax=unclassified Mesorhizobium TaxID=325217 RepID=UPI000FC9C4EF|nr:MULTISPECIES: hypothetical protein [unclassified Mesorhizobium]TGP74859.1 hypothetical protein EN870_26735 [bacterium M00.F.Ca.ET.227.01.1.1]TGP84755.1 hypothetical protein EN864_29540 [bacterium M00.F.Ca.ET.221.01.1.1]TGP87811.1 hypothetical protein EN865_28835 [bacterium M00.F.Ca.ET.222.01.1.1]TGT70912.1 hypothetical protein EN802_21645 [bacterium M00.F.Ca.ET.159.01.1.1]TGT82555.1 hypothetical protein EN800_19805 [bacterium M00.F.Ca.ET.157.01.1.1]TGT97542.1 hypothetical protein EN806_492